MLEFLSLISIFSTPIFFCSLSILGISVRSGQLKFLNIGIAIMGYAFLFYHNCVKQSLKSKFLITVAVFVVVLIGCGITIYQFGSFNEVFRGQFLNFGSITIVAGLLGYTLAQKKSIKYFGKFLPILVIVMTFVTFVTCLTSTGRSDTGYLADSSGLAYQNTSYIAAYSFGLTLMMLVEFDKLSIAPIFKKIKWLFYLFLPMQALTLLLAGGRGAFVLFLLLCCYWLYLNAKSLRKNPKRILLIALVFAAVVLLVLIINSGRYDTKGWERLQNFMKDTSDTGRASLRQTAIYYFWDSPLYGNGIGSINYLSFFSHNIFADFLCETGILGTALLVIALIRYGVIQWKLIKKDTLNRFIFIFFSFGFVMSNSSGYYLSNALLWFAVSYCLTAPKSHYE